MKHSNVSQVLFFHCWFTMLFVFCLKLQLLANNVYAKLQTVLAVSEVQNHIVGCPRSWDLVYLSKEKQKGGNFRVAFHIVFLTNFLSFILLNLMKVESKCRPLLRSSTFWLVMTLSGFLGLAISFTSMWFLHQTGATTYR